MGPHSSGNVLLRTVFEDACGKYARLFSDKAKPAQEGEPQAPLSSLGHSSTDRETLGNNFLYSDTGNYGERLYLLCSKFGVSLDEARGGYKVVCSITKQGCNNCRGIPDSVGCEFGKLKLVGLGPAEARIMCEIARFEYTREASRLGILFTGKKPWEDLTDTSDDKARAESLKRKTEEKISDPFKNFPYDVSYPSPQKVADFAKFYNVAAKVGLASPLQIWDKQRQEAALGKEGILARRCSVNDNLWNLYKKTPNLTLDGVLKRMKAQYYLSRYNLETDPQQRLLLLDKFKEA